MSCVVSVDKAETNFEFSNKGTFYATRNVFVILIHSLLSVIFHDLIGRGQPVYSYTCIIMIFIK